MGSVNLTEGTASGTFKDGENFDFKISSAVANDVTITGKDENGGSTAWFSSDPYPAKIPAGSTSVTVEAVMVSAPGTYFTYIVTGINVTEHAHIQVGSSMHAHAKAS